MQNSFHKGMQNSGGLLILAASHKFHFLDFQLLRVFVELLRVLVHTSTECLKMPPDVPRHLVSIERAEGRPITIDG